jgi:hypothetical protein
VSDEECKSESVNSDVATTTAGREWWSCPLVCTHNSNSDSVAVNQITLIIPMMGKWLVVQNR